MSIIAWLILGLVAGFIASKIVNKSGEGLILDIVLGIVGAVVGGFLFSALGATRLTGFNLYGLFVAVVGAVVVLVIYHSLVGRRPCRHVNRSEHSEVRLLARLPRGLQPTLLT